MTTPHLIQPKQPRREFKNYSGIFFNIHLTAQTWALVTPSVCPAKRNTLVANIWLMMKRVRQR
jgi:hypothetical protein